MEIDRLGNHNSIRVVDAETPNDDNYEWKFMMKLHNLGSTESKNEAQETASCLKFESHR